MKYIQPMNCKEFAEYLLTLKTGDTIEFGTSLCELTPQDPNAVECWYFAKVMEIKGYDSRFILLDYAGGEEAFAIPLNNYKNTCDDDDRQIVPGYLAEYFKRNPNIDEVVYVKMEEDV